MRANRTAHQIEPLPTSDPYNGPTGTEKAVAVGILIVLAVFVAAVLVGIYVAMWAVFS